MAGLLLTAAHGDLSGTVRIAGRPVQHAPGDVGLLSQDPAAGVVAETAGRDVAFGLENRALPREAIWPRVHDALAATRFPYGPERATRALSGGETQRLTLAGALALGSRVLLLDEPTSMLDPVAAASVREAVRRQTAQRGTTTIVVEHHLEPWLDYADRLVVLGRGGRIVADGPVDTVLAAEGAALAEQGVWVPGLPAPTPLAVPQELVEPWRPGPDSLLAAEDVEVRLRRSLVEPNAPRVCALRGVDASLHSGRTLALTGISGAGKSTLVAVLAGLQRPTAGDVRAHPELATRRGRAPWRWRSADLAARLAWVAQLPEQAVATRTVADEVLCAARACGRDGDRAETRAHGLLNVLGLEDLGSVSPYHLSGGEQRRLMVAAALAHGPLGILLDEPTVGQDRGTWGAVVGIMVAARSAGASVVISSHDAVAVDATADTTLTLDQGRVVA